MISTEHILVSSDIMSIISTTGKIAAAAVTTVVEIANVIKIIIIMVANSKHNHNDDGIYSSSTFSNSKAIKRTESNKNQLCFVNVCHRVQLSAHPPPSSRP